MTMPQTTIPSVETQWAVEDVNWSIDCTAQLTGAQIPTSVTVTLTTQDGTPVTLTDTPSVNGVIIVQRVRGEVLTAGLDYRMVAVFTPSGTTNILALLLYLSCPF